MTSTALADIQATPPSEAPPRRRSRRWARIVELTARSLVPVILALVAGGILIAALGENPFAFYGNVWKGGMQLGGWQDSAMRMAPLLMIAVGLIVVFRANIWNLGYDGQFLLGAALISGWGPGLMGSLPKVLAWVVLFLIAGTAAALWTIVPAFLRARWETNEIITTLMMSFIGVDIANILVKGPFQDASVNIPQTKVIPIESMLPAIPGTRIHIGVIVALVIAGIIHYVLTRTAFGLRLHVFGANPRAARHVGIDVRRLVLRSFLWSGALIGISAAIDMLGVWGYMRANWNPAYGDTVIPFVFLARLNVLAVVPFIAFFAVLSTGGDLAAQQANLPSDIILVLVALILLFMTVIEYLGRRRDLGGSYLSPGLWKALRAPLFRRGGDR